jgi:hypothetical protein
MGETPGGVRVPVPFVTLRPEAAYDVIYGGVWHCPECLAPIGTYRETCTTAGCQGRNPDWKPTASGPASAAAQPQTGAARGTADPDAEEWPIGNYWNPDLWECWRGHKFDHRYNKRCPDCHPGQGPGSGPGGGSQLPAKFRAALSLGPMR